MKCALFIFMIGASCFAFAQAPAAEQNPLPVSKPASPGLPPGTGAPPVANAGSAADANASGKSGAGMFSGLMDPFDYDSRGRRDPFARPIPDQPLPPGTVHGPLLPLQKFELVQLRLTGIIWDVHRPKAMIMDPTGQTHIVGTNTKLGPHNGYIAVIREGEIVVVETIDQEGRLVSTAQVVKIAK